MSNQEIYNYLNELNICRICCLRYFKARGKEYDNVNETFQNLHIEPIQNVTVEINKDEPLNKKHKENICSTCFGIFSEDFLGKMISRILSEKEIEKYQCKKIVTAISLPTLLSVQQLAIWLLLLEKFPKNFSKENMPDVPIKEAVKLILNPKICKALNKFYDVSNSEGIMLNIFLSHKNEKSGIEKMSKLLQELELAKLSKHRKKIVASRSLLEKCFLPIKIKLDDFQRHFSCPEIPNETVYLENVSFTGPTVFVAGRYRKLCRNLPNSPWILDGKRVLENSIQEIIVENVVDYFGTTSDKIIFSSSGREDVDVRCLGDGRPFVLEIPNSKMVEMPQKIAAYIELNIEKTKKVSVINLQMVRRSEVGNVKIGEIDKKKLYRALCILDTPVTVDVLEKLNMPNGFVTQQITPIRVLHRRPLHTRSKIIHSVKAAVDKNKNNVLILDIITQAGCYVKELVHGEFGRTNPSISSIIGKKIDIIALDVNGVLLDWPKPIDNRKL